MLLAASVHMVLWHLAAALVLSTQTAHFVPCMSHHTTPTNASWNTSAQARDCYICYNCSVFTLGQSFLLLQKHDDLITETEGF